MKHYLLKLTSTLSILELRFTNGLSTLLFGDSIIEDYQDLKLPSEERPVKKKNIADLKKQRRKRRSQFQLLFFRPLKKQLYRLMVGIESLTQVITFTRSRPVNSYENTYR